MKKLKKLLQKSLVALALFGVADAAFAVEGRNDATNEQIDTRNNGRPAWEAFSGVAQEVTRLIHRGAIVPAKMRTKLNDRFLAFSRELESNGYSENVVSADEFIKCFTHPVLAELRDEHRRNIFFSLMNDEEAKSDILRHCLGSQAFKDSFLRLGVVGRIISDLEHFYGVL